MDDFNLPGPSSIRMNPNGFGVAEFGGGAAAQTAIFYIRPVHNPVKSAEEGCQVFDNKLYVRISPPGERLNIIDRPAKPEDTRLWPHAYAAFQQNKEQVPEGTPIDLLYPENPAVGATLKAHGVHTIQQCAQLSSNAIENVGMGAQRWVNDAQTYLKSATKGAATVQLRREIEALERDKAVLERQLDALKQENVELRAKAGGRSGVSLEQVQEMIAGAQGRPAMPVSNPRVSQKFDPQLAQINATHGSKVAPTTRDSNKKKRVRVRF